MKLVKYGRCANGRTWGIAENSYGWFIVVGRTIFDVCDQIVEEMVGENVFGSYKKAMEYVEEVLK